YVGGSTVDAAFGLALDAAGNSYLAGATVGTFPVSAGAVQGNYGGGDIDAFVFKLNAAGTERVYATYLGGTGSDYARAIAVDSAGNAYVAGEAEGGFPVTTGAAHTSFSGGESDAFIAKLNATGTALLYSTYLGGGSSDSAAGIAIDQDRNAYVTGSSRAGLPT